MEKKKETSRFPKQKLWGCLSFLFLASVGICGTVIIMLEFAGQMTRTSLADEVIPTAEALLDMPYRVALPDGDTSISLDVWEGSPVSLDRICVRLNVDEQLIQTFKDNSQLYIDEGWVFLASWIYDFPGDLDAPRKLCATGELQAGIHLIEFHLKDSFWSEPIHIQQWAIEID